MKYALVLENEILIKNYHQQILKRMRKEISKGNRKFKEYKFSDIEFTTMFENSEEEIKKYLEYIRKKEKQRMEV